jgi:hypothetical protein
MLLRFLLLEDKFDDLNFPGNFVESGRLTGARASELTFASEFRNPKGTLEEDPDPHFSKSLLLEPRPEMTVRGGGEDSERSEGADAM